MKPTLKQIFDFGLEIVEKDYNRYIKSTREYSKYTAKRYNINVIVYASVVWFNYSKKEVAEYLNINLMPIYQYIATINKSISKKELAEELYNSLMYLQDKSFTTFRASILKDYKKDGGKVCPHNTKFEKWLINRLYETEK